MQIKVQDLEPGMVVLVPNLKGLLTVSKVMYNRIDSEYVVWFNSIKEPCSFHQEYVFERVDVPSNPEEDEFLYSNSGFTKIWSGTGAKELQVFFKIGCSWQSEHEDAFQLIETEPGHFAIFVANEFVDWAHYRRTGEFIPCLGQQPIDPMR